MKISMDETQKTLGRADEKTRTALVPLERHLVDGKTGQRSNFCCATMRPFGMVHSSEFAAHGWDKLASIEV